MPDTVGEPFRIRNLAESIDRLSGKVSDRRVRLAVRLSRPRERVEEVVVKVAELTLVRGGYGHRLGVVPQRVVAVELARTQRHRQDS